MKLQSLKKRLGAALALAAISAVVAGCAQIPHDGAVGIGPNIQGSVSGDYFYYSPSLPVDGMSAYEIVDGFLSAGTGPQNDYSVARKFLAPGIRSSWNPNAGLLIEHGSPVIEVNDSNQATVTIDVEGEVTSDGHYIAHPTLPTRTLTYQVSKIDGDWRITSAPNLTVLLRPNFDVLFRGYSVYFFDQSFHQLVPDLRWFPARPSTATRLVNALLSGPSPWLAPGAVTAFPDGTKLAIDSVAITGGVASVDLSSQILWASADHKLYLQAQLWATLKQLPNVLSMVLLVDHVQQQIVTYDPSEPAKVSSLPVELSDTGLAHVGLGETTAIAGSSGVPATAKDFALSRDESWLAVLGSRGISLGQLTGPKVKMQLVDGRDGLLVPAYDSNGYFWSVPRSSKATIKAFNPRGTGKAVGAPLLAGFTRLGFAISPEGSRVAMVLRRGKTSRLVVAAVNRANNGDPGYLGNPEFVSTQAVPVGPLAWVDANSVAVLTEDEGTKRAPVIFTIGGTERRLPAVDGAVGIAAGNEAGDIYLRLESGYLEVFRGTGWSGITSNSKSLHFPG